MHLPKMATVICILVIAFNLFLLSGCGGTSSPASPSSVRTSVIPKSNTQTSGADVQSGDIPDTQAFVKYTSAQGGYELDVPEGWARTVNGIDVSFVNKLDGVQVVLTQASAAPSVEIARAQQAVELEKTGRAVRDVQVQSKQLTSGSAILITYTSDSEPNAVTGKQIRLANSRYLLFHNGKLAALTLWAPQGADNVDQWVRMSNSFKWV